VAAQKLGWSKNKHRKVSEHVTTVIQQEQRNGNPLECTVAVEMEKEETYLKGIWLLTFLFFAK
jgi:hypothetical protein